MAEYCGGGLSVRPGDSGRRPPIPPSGGPALGVVGVALLAPGDRKAVALAAVHYKRNRLGGLAERDRQAPGGQRIERAGMARAPCGKTPFFYSNRGGPSDAQ